MKRMTLQSCFFLALTLFAFTTATDSKLVGKWKGRSEGEMGIVGFEKEGYAYFIIKDEKMGGKDYNMNGQLVDMVYETNDKVTPKAVDFIMKDKASGQVMMKLQGIYEFIGDNQLKLRVNFDGTVRPKGFDEKSNPSQMILDRVME